MSLSADVLGGKAVMLHYHGSGRRGAKGIYANDGDPGADKGLPTVVANVAEGTMRRFAFRC